MAQRAFEKGRHVVYEDAQGKQINLGLGFSPALTDDGRVALIRGRRFGYGERFDCNRRDFKNWIAVYDPATRAEKTLFNRALPFGSQGPGAICVFEQMQLSPDGSTLYLVSPVYATAGSPAIVQLGQGAVTYVPGVNDVYVIETGAHRGELIYDRRMVGRDHMIYPFIHAGADGRKIRVIGEATPLFKSVLAADRWANRHRRKASSVSDRRRQPTWTEVKAKLASFDRTRLLSLIRDLYAADNDNRAFLHTRFGLGEDVLEPYKQTIKRWLLPDVMRNQDPSVTKAKQAVTSYKKAVGDPAGLAELMVFYCECAADFCSDVGYQEKSCFASLVHMFEQALMVARLVGVRGMAENSGYGVGFEMDFILENLTDGTD